MPHPTLPPVAPEQLEANRPLGLCAVCLRQACDGKSCDWALGAQPLTLSALDRADIRRELEARAVHLAELLVRSVAHRSPGARRMLVLRLERVRELIALLATLCLLALAGCAQEHGRIEGPPLYVHLCEAMPAADQDAWGEAAAAVNEERGELALWVGHGPPIGCSTVDVCPSSDVHSAEMRIGPCTVTVRYAPGSAADVASQELGLLLGRLP